MQAVILAAGQGKRLGSLSQSRSKPTLPILGTPIILRIIDDLVKCGIQDFIVVVNPKDEQLLRLLTSPAPGIAIKLVFQPKPCGMAHALYCASPLIRGEFILSASDNLVPLASLQAMITCWVNQPDLKALLALIPITREQASRTSVVQESNGWIQRIIEKPSQDEIISLISSMPIYIFTTDILAYLSKIRPSSRGEYELQDAIQMLINEKSKVRGFSFSSRENLTDLEDLLAININYLKNEKTTFIHPTVCKEADVIFIPPFYIGVDTIIEAGCTIGPNVIIEGFTQVSRGASLQDCLLLKGVSIQPHERIQGKVIIYQN